MYVLNVQFRIGCKLRDLCIDVKEVEHNGFFLVYTDMKDVKHSIPGDLIVSTTIRRIQ